MQRVYDWRLLAVILAASTLTLMAGATISPIINMMKKSLDVSAGQAALIITTHSAVVALVSPWIGKLIDTVGVRRPLLAGLVLYGASGGSGLFIESYWELLASRVVLGFGVSAIFISVTVIITDLFVGTDRDLMMGRRISANNFGGIVWPALGGLLGLYSWHSPFAIYLVAILIAAVGVRVVSETHVEKGRVSGQGHQSVLRILAANPMLFAVFALMLLTTVEIYTVVIFLPQLLPSLGITSTLGIGLFVSMMTFASGTTSFLYAKIKSKVTYRTLYAIAISLWVVSLITISLSIYPSLIALAVALSGVGQGLALPASLVWASDISPPAFSGRILSYLGTSAFFGQFLAPVLLNPVAAFGLRAVFIATGSICFLALLTIGVVAIRAGRKRKKTTS